LPSGEKTARPPGPRGRRSGPVPGRSPRPIAGPCDQQAAQRFSRRLLKGVPLRPAGAQRGPVGPRWSSDVGTPAGPHPGRPTD
jgi:hypothetical protein